MTNFVKAMDVYLSKIKETSLNNRFYIAEYNHTKHFNEGLEEYFIVVVTDEVAHRDFVVSIPVEDKFIKLEELINYINNYIIYAGECEYIANMSEEELTEEINSIINRRLEND